MLKSIKRQYVTSIRKSFYWLAFNGGCAENKKQKYKKQKPK